MIGTVIGSYRLTESLGDGGVGAVFRAVDAGTGREAAVRIFAGEVGRDPMLAERLRAMVPILKRLQHSNVGAVYDLITVGQQLGFFLEYVAGVTLDQARARSGRMAPNVAVSCAVQTLRGLEHAHEHGLFHHALRPGNVLVTPTGNIKVMDLGIGHALGANRKTREDRLLNVLAYLAPEQIQNQPGDTRADIYAVGVILYELLTGKLPFEHRTEFALRQAHLNEPPASPRFLAPGLPDWVDQAVMRALAKTPSHRFANATELRAVLEAGLGLSTSGHVAVVRDAGGASMGSAFSAAPPIPPGQTAGDSTVAMPVVVAPPMPGAAPAPQAAGPLPVETPEPGPRRPTPPPASDATVVLPVVSAAPPPAARPSPPRPSPMEPTPALGIELPVLTPPTPSAPGTAKAGSAATPPAPASAPEPKAAPPPAADATLAGAPPVEAAPAPDATLVGASVTGPAASTPGAPPPPASETKAPAKGAEKAAVPAKGKAPDKGKADAKGQAAATKPAAGAGRRTGLILVAAVLVVAAGAAAGFYWMQYGAGAPSTNEAAAVTDPATTDAAATPPVSDAPPPAATGEMPPAEAVPPPVSTVPPAAASVPPPVPAAAAPAPPKRTPKPKPLPAPAVSEPAPSPVVSAPPPAPAPAPEPKATPKTQPDMVLPDTSYRKVKIVTQQGEGTREIDVNLMFLEDRIGVAPSAGGATFRSVRYRDITSASYAREQRKRLFIKTSKHLLTIETSAEPLILRLDKDNFDAIIRQLESRSKKVVER